MTLTSALPLPAAARPAAPARRRAGFWALAGALVALAERAVEKARLAHLRHAHPQLHLPAGVRLEPGLLWRVDPGARVAVGSRSHLRRDTEIKADAGARIQIGARVHLGPQCMIAALKHVEIGDDCLIAERVSIRDHDHGTADPRLPYHAQGYTTAPVRIGSNVWLGANVTIVKGVTLGDNVVVGAGAVVTRSFPANCVIAGVPARVIKQLDEASTVDVTIRHAEGA